MLQAACAAGSALIGGGIRGRVRAEGAGDWREAGGRRAGSEQVGGISAARGSGISARGEREASGIRASGWD